MMVSKKETALIRSFVCEQLSDEPDLSTLTLGILKKRYLAHAKCESLSSEAKKFMKQVVEEELTKMQENDQNGIEEETEQPQKKRKRRKENEEVESEEENESKAKKSRSNRSSSSESEDTDDCKTGSGDEAQIKSSSDDEARGENKKKPEQKRPGNGKSQMTSDDSSGDEIDKSEKSESGSECDENPKEMVKKKGATAKKGKARSSETSGEKQTQGSDEDSESDEDKKSSRSEKINDSESSNGEKGEKVQSEKKNNDSDSDSSSLPSLEEEGDSRTKNEPKNKKKQKTVKTDKSARGQKDEDKAVVRLKRYIALCGVRRNYKKLLDGCRSVRSKVAVLKKELEDLGVHGNPSIEKCKKVRMKREEAQEVAELDVSNIITTQGRPKRRGTSAMLEQQEPPSSAYQRTLNSGSDSDQENCSHRGKRKISEWANLHGIISDDADSD